MAIGRRQVALGPLLKDEIIGDCFNEEVGPISRMHGARIVEFEQEVSFLRRDDAVFVENASQGTQVGILDASTIYNLVNRKQPQPTHR